MKPIKILCAVICCLGIVCIITGALGFRKGQIEIHKGAKTLSVTRVEKPVQFWLDNGLPVVIGCVFVYGGIRGILSNKK